MASMDHKQLPIDELAEQFLQRYRRGERPAISEIVELRPELADDIRELFPALILMEGERQIPKGQADDKEVEQCEQLVREFGLELGEDVEVRVWDSTAELRYIVLPERPAGTGNWTEDQLAALVTRDAMIGVTKVKAPGQGESG